jgi:hypothetical protein
MSHRVGETIGIRGVQLPRRVEKLAVVVLA